jgi:DnaJ family protein C protein 19
MIKSILFFAIIGVIIWLVRRAFMSQPAMSPAEAAKILELPVTASADEINAAHRRLIAKVHPDAGGSADLAARVNAARDILLRQISPR